MTPFLIGSKFLEDYALWDVKIFFENYGFFRKLRVFFKNYVFFRKLRVFFSKITVFLRKLPGIEIQNRIISEVWRLRKWRQCLG